MRHLEHLLICFLLVNGLSCRHYWCNACESRGRSLLVTLLVYKIARKVVQHRLSPTAEKLNTKAKGIRT